MRVESSLDCVTVTSYRYVYGLGPDPNSERGWIFRYEYPRFSPPGYPHSPSHAHVNLGAVGGQVAGKTFKKFRFPTGFVTLEQILLHLILEWDLPVLGGSQSPDAREEALVILRESLAQSRRDVANR